MKVKRYSFWLCLITALSTLVSLMANLISGRVGFFGPFVAPMGVYFFPIIYVLSDITSEVYGYGVSRKVAWWTNLCNLLFVGGILAVICTNTPAPWSMESDDALKLLLIGTDGVSGMLRVTLAGVIAAVLGGWVNDIIFQAMKHAQVEKMGHMTQDFWKRKLVSSLGGEAVDTLVFITLAFLGTPAWGIAMYIVQFILKYSVEAVTCPIASFLASKLYGVEGYSAFEDRNNFNIFGLRRK